MTAWDVKRFLEVGGRKLSYFSLEALQEGLYPEIRQLPYALKVLLENLLRFEDGKRVTAKDIEALATWTSHRGQGGDISYRPARVLMQDFTGVPALVDLAAMRDAMGRLGGKPDIINPLRQVDLVVDHSIMVDQAGTPQAAAQNQALEYQRNGERYAFFKWGQRAFHNMGIVPPGTGICHQVNIEHLAPVVCVTDDVAYPDTLVGTDSHTTMVNALGVLGWGVGGIEAEAIMLGQPLSMLIPEVVGVRLEGVLPDGITATDLVLTITQRLRAKGVVGKFVEYCGPGLAQLSGSDRATLANMAPEYGATCGFFPVDQETLNYLRLTGRSQEQLELVEAYCKAQGLWRGEEEPAFSDKIEIDLALIEPSLAGPKRPQDRVPLTQVPWSFEGLLKEVRAGDQDPVQGVETEGLALKDGDVVIAAITSCTNTSNPSVLMAAGLLAKKAALRGLKSKPWVKTSLAPGSQVVTDYLAAAGLTPYLEQLGFYTVGYGCTTCIGNSGPLNPVVESAIVEDDLLVAAVLSGNRNFEGRIHPLVKANYLASPPLVVAYALVGSMLANVWKGPLGKDPEGKPVYLKDIWPSREEVEEAIAQVVTRDMFQARYANVFKGDAHWEQLKRQEAPHYVWDEKSTYIQRPPYFEGMTMTAEMPQDILGARPLLILGDSITTDHISPAGSIKKESPAGVYLQQKGVKYEDFNSYGARRGNHEVMVRGTFANIRLQNEMVPGHAGGMSMVYPARQLGSVYDVAMAYQQDQVPLVVVAGKEYGTGSSRDWAAKGTCLLGVKVVIAESFERIHRSNLVGMGILPLEFKEGETRHTLGLVGTETFDVVGLASLTPGADVQVRVHREDGSATGVTLKCRIDTEDEKTYYQEGGILPYVVRTLLKKSA